MGILSEVTVMWSRNKMIFSRNFWILSVVWLVFVCAAVADDSCQAPPNCTCSQLPGGNNRLQVECFSPGTYTRIQRLINRLHRATVKLYIKNQKIKTLRLVPKGFSKLTRLTVLSITHSHVESIDENFFSTASTIRTLHLNGNNISSITKKTFKGLPSLGYLSLASNNLWTIPKGLFGSLRNLVQLDLSENHFHKGGLVDESLRGLRSLESLTIVSCGLTKDVSINLTQSPSIRLLDMRENNLGELAETTLILPKPNNVETLKLRFGGLFSLRKTDVYKQFTNLYSLDLSNNQITEIPSGFFKLFPKIEEIKLENNRITHLKFNTFVNLPNLKLLALKRNGVVFIEPGCFQDLPSLASLELDSNNLTRIKPRTISHLPALESLDLRNNSISRIGVNAFIGLKNLEYLILINNSLTTLNHFGSGKPLAVANFNAQSNGITEVPSIVFDKLSNVTSVDLSRNELRRFVVLTDLPYLRYLSLFSNRIQSLTAFTFSHMPQLEVLYLSNNEISTLPSGIFSSNTKLKTVALSYNQLVHIEVEAFAALPALTDLMLWGNPLCLMEGETAVLNTIGNVSYSPQIPGCQPLTTTTLTVSETNLNGSTVTMAGQVNSTTAILPATGEVHQGGIELSKDDIIIIVGAALGGLVLIILIILIVVVCCRKRRKREHHRQFAKHKNKRRVSEYDNVHPFLTPNLVVRKGRRMSSTGSERTFKGPSGASQLREIESYQALNNNMEVAEISKNASTMYNTLLRSKLAPVPRRPYGLSPRSPRLDTDGGESSDLEFSYRET